jgi:hypothetical protein
VHVSQTGGFLVEGRSRGRNVQCREPAQAVLDVGSEALFDLKRGVVPRCAASSTSTSSPRVEQFFDIAPDLGDLLEVVLIGGFPHPASLTAPGADS